MPRGGSCSGRTAIPWACRSGDDACAIGLGSHLGTIERGKQADLTPWNTDGMEMLCYRMGTNQVRAVVKRGKVVVG